MRLSFFVFLAVAGTVTGLAHMYLYRRLVKSTVQDARRRLLGRWLLTGVWLLLFLSGFLRLLLGRFSTVAGLLNAVAWTWMGLASLMLVCFVTIDLAHASNRLLAWTRSRLRPQEGRGADVVDALPSPERRLFLSRTLAGGAVLVSGNLTAYGAWRAYSPPVVTELALKLPRLPAALDGLTLVHLSDIHVGPLIQRPFVEDLVRRCQALKPDLVAITGDLVDGDVPTLGPAVAALADLQSRFGTFFVTGNHEYYSGDLEWCAMLERLGMTVLRNRHVRVGDAGGSFDMVGVDDWRGAPGGLRAYDLERALGGRDPSRAAILLAHQPHNFEKAVERGIGLQLSGHTHGGQMFPMTLAISLLWRHSAGHYAHQEGHLYVSRGTGFWGPPVRVGSPPEIVKLVLQPG